MENETTNAVEQVTSNPAVTDSLINSAPVEQVTPPASNEAPAENNAEEVKQSEDAKTKEDEAKEKPTPRAPEKYEDFKAEGVEVAPDVKDKFEAIVRELDLPQAEAQKLFNLAPEISKMYVSRMVSAAEKASQEWRGATVADPEIGGSGDPKVLDANLALIAKARDAFATPELLKILSPFNAKENVNGTGLGNHPEIARLFLRLGKAISEDNKLVSGTSAGREPTSLAQKLYAKQS